MLSDNIKILRKKKGYSQETLAEQLHVVRQTISKWEKGISVPDAVMLDRMAELFEVQKAAISKHLKNIFTSGELMEDSVVSVLETTAADGKKYPTRYYNLDAIIAVGYRVNSKKATMFRIWANRILKEYIIKGYVMDDERLKEPQNFFGKDYFETKKRRTAP